MGVILGRCEAANPEPMNTDLANLGNDGVHGFPLARE